MKDFVANAVVLQVVHHVCSIPLQEWPYTPERSMQGSYFTWSHAVTHFTTRQISNANHEVSLGVQPNMLKNISKALALELHVHVFHEP